MIYYYGEDTYGARQAIDVLAREEGTRIRWLDRDDLEEHAPAEWISRGSQGLFGREMLVARDVSNLPVGLQDDLLKALAAAPRTLCLLWDRGRVDKRSKLYRAVKSLAREFRLLEPSVVVQWLQEEAARRGGKVTDDAAQVLVERVGVDRWRLISELEKLLIVSDEVTRESVVSSVPVAPSAEIFTVLDSLVRGDKARVVGGVKLLLQEGNNECYILSMLAYQFRTLLTIRIGIDQGQSEGEIVRSGPLKPYSVSKNFRHAQGLSRSYLRAALAKILATDFAIRQGRVQARTGLLMLVIGLVTKKAP